MFDTIKTFIDVAADGSFSAVARRHDIAVSSVARKIGALEAELGAKLFVRSSRSIRLTDAGEQFLSRAKNIVAELDDAKRTLADLHGDHRGLLTVTVPAAFGRRYVVPAIASFLRLHPLIEIEMHLSDERVDLTAHRVDVAIRIGILPDSDFVATPLAPMRRLVCASPDYIARHGRPATPEQLMDHNCLTVASAPLPAGWWCFAGVQREAALAVHGTLRTDDTEALLEAAVAGIGIVHLASWLVGDMVKAGKLLVLFPDLPAPLKKIPSAIHAVRMPGRSHAAKAQLFIAHLKTCFGDPPYWDRF
ncbi:MAG TPA: LysR family transcriptional regulator [Janthinobacterium sp.]|nr:LysR family transcriptional regulator [Janthinobacterium sp.]